MCRNVPFEDLDIYTRLNGMMDGRGGAPLRQPTPFLGELAGLASENELNNLLADKEKVSAVYYDGGLHLWALENDLRNPYHKKGARKR